MVKLKEIQKKTSLIGVNQLSGNLGNPLVQYLLYKVQLHLLYQVLRRMINRKNRSLFLCWNIFVLKRCQGWFGRHYHG